MIRPSLPRNSAKPTNFTSRLPAIGILLSLLALSGWIVQKNTDAPFTNLASLNNIPAPTTSFSKHSLSSEKLTLSTSNVDFATLPSGLQYQALHSKDHVRSTKAGTAKHDQLPSKGSLKTAQTEALEGVDLETLPPQVQLKALIGSHKKVLHAKVLESAPFDNLLSDGPLGTPHISHKYGGVKLGSRVGLDGGVQLLRSANQIIAERVEKTREQNMAKYPNLIPSASAEPSIAALIAAVPVAVLYDAGGHDENGSAQKESQLSLEERRLRTSVKALEQRAADAEIDG